VGEWEALEADFKRFYGEDLRTLCWGPSSDGSRWGCRRLLTHIRSLPPEAALIRSQIGAPLGWDNQTEMGAQTVDLLHALIRLTQAAHMENPPRGDLPRVPRPYEVEPEAPTQSLSDLSDFLKEP